MTERGLVPRIAHSLTAVEIHALVGRNDPVMLEIGCNDGTDTRRFLEEFPAIQIYCFEPDPRPRSRFWENVRPSYDTRLQFLGLSEAAVSEEDGSTTLFQSGGTPPTGQFHPDVMRDWDMSSSICQPTGHLDWSPWCSFEKSVTVPTIRLDSFLYTWPPAFWGGLDFIWADVQGAEEKMILGGRETLNRTRYLYTEFYDRPMYDGQPNLARIAELLPDFALRAIYGGDNALFANRRFDRR